MLCFKNDGVWRDLRNGFPVTNADGIMVSWDSMSLWSTEEREDFGIFEAPEVPPAPEGKIELSRIIGGEGDRPEWILTYYDAPPFVPVVPVMPDLTDRQFARGLRDEGIITFDECLAFVGPGTIPEALLNILNTIPDQTARENAIIDVAGAQRYEFDNPLVEFVRMAMQWTPEHLREKWMEWSTI